MSTPTAEDVREFLRLAGMLGFVERGRAEFLDRLGDKATDDYIRRIVHAGARAYGGDTAAGAALWEPALVRQARELGLFSDPFAVTGLPSSSSDARH